MKQSAARKNALVWEAGAGEAPPSESEESSNRIEDVLQPSSADRLECKTSFKMHQVLLGNI